jgi:hypothetical protein
MVHVSDISLNGTIVSWVANDDVTFDVSATYLDGEGVQSLGLTSSPFDLSGAVDVSRVVNVIVIGYDADSNPSAPLSITYIPPPPSFDLELSAVENPDGSVKLSWVSPSVPQDSYVLTDNSDISYPVGPMDTSATLTGLTFGDTYEFTLTAVYSNSQYVGSIDDVATVTINPILPPSFDLELSAVENPDGSVKLSWLSPSVPQDSYILTDNSDISYAVGPMDTSATLTGLTFGDTYEFTLTAVYSNVQYVGSIDDATSITIDPILPPSFDLELSAVQNPDGSVKLSWLSPSVPHDNYVLTDNLDISYAVSLMDTSATLTGLVFGDTYEFTLKAAYSSLQYLGSVDDVVTITIDPILPPSFDLSLSAVENPDGSVKLSWLSPSVPHDSYMLVDNSSNIYFVDSMDTSATLTGLTFGDTYEFTLTAVYSGDQYNGSVVDTVSVTINPILPPSFDLSFSAVQNPNGSVTLTWRTPDIQPDSYTLLDGNSNSYTVDPVNPIITLTGLTFGSTYEFTLTAVYSGVQYAGSINDIASVLIAPIMPPSYDLSLSAVENPDGSVKLSWIRPVDQPNRYELKDQFDISYSVGQMDTSATLTGLTFGAMYEFTLTAVYSGVQYAGSIDDMVPITIQPILPPPFDLSLQSVENMDGEVILTWNQPSIIPTSYTLTDNYSSNIYSVGSTDTTITMNSFVNGITYTFTLTAIYSNSQYDGSIQAQTSILYIAIQDFDISFHAIQNANGSVKVSWEQPPIAVSSYTLRDSNNVIYPTSILDSSSTLNGLTFGVSYEFTLIAVYSGGQYSGSIQAISSVFIAPIAPPAFDLSLQVVQNANGSAKLSWLSPSTPPNSFTLVDDNNNTYTVGVMDTSATTSILVFGDNYEFTLTAVYSGVQYSGSLQSIQSLFIAAVPPPVFDLSLQVVQNANGSATLTWLSPSTAPNSFTLTDNHSNTYAVGVMDTSATTSILVFGDNYIFTLTAVYSGLQYSGSLQSIQSLFIAPNAPPAFDLSLQVVQNANGSANLSWRSPSTAPNSFTLTDNHSNTYTVGVMDTSASTPVLVFGDNYIFTLTAVYSGLQYSGSLQSIQSLFIAPNAPPAFDLSLQVVQNANGSANLSWLSPSTAPNSFTLSDSFNNTYNVGVSDTSSTLVGLTFGVSYEFTLTAVYSGVQYSGSLQDVQTLFIATIAPPVFDLSLQAVQNANGSAKLSWRTPSTAPNSLTLTDSCNNTYTVGVMDTSATTSVLVFGDNYQFTLTAVYSGVQYNGSIQSIKSLFIAPVAPPAFDLSLNAVRNMNNSYTLSWIRPSITPNRYTLTDDSNKTYTVGVMDTSAITSVLVAGVNYRFTLTAEYSGVRYNGSLSSIVNTLMPLPPVTCFLENAPVLTPTGYRKISKLVAGDLVLTGDGRSVPIQRVAHSRVASGAETNPYIIPKGLYGATKRLLISPRHCVSTSTGMKEARLLGLKQETDMNTIIDYYNLELPSWVKDTMVVAGVTVESLAPVRRAKLSMEQFKAKLVRQYGKITPDILAKVEQTCRIVDGGYVEFPAMVSSKPSMK